MFYYVRSNYNKLNSRPKAHYSTFLGELESGSYLSRIPKYLALYLKLRRVDATVIYSFGIDFLVIAYLAKKRRTRIFYELGDIRQLRNKRLNQLFLFFLRNVIFKQVDKVFVTSDGFKSYVIKYYGVDETKLELRENKIYLKNIQTRPLINAKLNNEDQLVLGIIGYFRYQNVVDFVKTYCQTIKQNFKIVIYGHGEKLSEMLTYCNDENIEYRGQFNAAKDLDEIYSKVHFSYVVYDNSNLNVRLALPNKLYESMLYRVPLIVASNTYLSEIVRNLDIGISTDPDAPREVINFLNSNSARKMYHQFKENIEMLDSKMYLK